MYWKFVSGLLCVLMLLSGAAFAERVSDPQIIADGRQTYEKHCAACHGVQARGIVEDWKKPGADGKYPPPPLNGTAHAWHHPFSQLARVVEDGTARKGGKKPARSSTHKTTQIENTLHYVISLWPEEIFRGWEERGGYQ